MHNSGIDFDYQYTKNYKYSYDYSCDCSYCRNYYKAFRKNYAKTTEFLENFGLDIEYL